MSMMDSDFDAWFQTLSPEDQAFILQQMGMGEANQVPYSFGGAYAPELSSQEYDISSYMGIPADYNSKGEQLPWGLDQASQAATLQKNRNSLLADQVTGAFAGPGAYDPAAFEPRDVYSGEALDTPGAREAAFYRDLQGGGFQSLIAEDILAGTDPATAVSKVLQLASLPDSETLTPEMRAQRDAVIASLAPARATGGPQAPSRSGDQTPAQELATKYDLDMLYDFANQIGSSLAKDPTGGYTDPETGVTYERPPEREWSAAAEKYRSLGLPFPTARYTDPEYTSPLEDQDRLMQLMQAEQESAAAQQRAVGAGAEATQMEGLLGQYEGERAFRNQPIAGQSRMINGAPTPNVGPVAPGRDQTLQPVRTPNPADQFRALAGQESLELPNYWRGGGGDFNFGEAIPGAKKELFNLDITGFTNALQSVAGGEGRDAGKVSAKAVKSRRGLQEEARKAMGRRIDLNQRGQGERDAALQLGAQLALDKQGRTPLTDAMLKRLMTARAQGY